MSKIETITVDGVEYIRKDSVKSPSAPVVKGLRYCIVRTYSAGVFAGYVKGKGAERVVFNARRLWSWSGAASLSQLAVDGTTKPDGCKFPTEVTEIELTNIIEVIPCTEKARQSIASVKVWQME